MKKNRGIALICFALLLLNAACANAVSIGFDYSKLKMNGMFNIGGTDYLYGDEYIYSFSEDENEWFCGIMTMGEPYLMLYIQGNISGKETLIQVEAAFDSSGNTESATVIEFMTEDLIHTLELTPAAQERELEGFPIYKANYNIIKALASTDAFSVRAYIDGNTHEIPISEEARKIIYSVANVLVEQKVMAHYSPTFAEESSVQQMNELISYSINAAKDQKDSIIPQHSYSYNKSLTTMGETNALKAARLYLEVMPFSFEGLVEQLEYEGYSHAEAVYGATNCGADWYQQAVKSAKNYLDLMPFSRSELIEQLEYEGYTYDQAVYGVERNGY